MPESDLPTWEPNQVPVEQEIEVQETEAPAVIEVPEFVSPTARLRHLAAQKVAERLKARRESQNG